MTTKNEVEYVGDFDIYNAEETLILLLEFALVEDLHRDYRRILDSPAHSRQWPDLQILFRIDAYTSKVSFQYGFSVFLMTEVVCVCSASTVITQNGSGSLRNSRL